MYQDQKNGPYYDFSPVFDPDNTKYYFAVPELMTGDLYLDPVYYTDADYSILVSTYYKAAALRRMVTV